MEVSVRRFKYSKTWHLPWSDSKSSDDHWHTNTDHFIGQEVVVSEKLDGECTTLYPDYIHARSIDSQSHPSQSNARRHWGQIRHNIPQGWRVVCENLEALHSIYYQNLDHYLYVIGIYDENNVCQSWDDTKAYAAMLDLPTVPELYRGPWDEKLIRSLWTGKSTFETYTEKSARDMWKMFPRVPLPEALADKDLNSSIINGSEIARLQSDTGEGYVVRRSGEFHYEGFSLALSKYVRPNHVTTSNFWKMQEVIPNGLKNSLQ